MLATTVLSQLPYSSLLGEPPEGAISEMDRVECDPFPPPGRTWPTSWVTWRMRLYFWLMGWTAFSDGSLPWVGLLASMSSWIEGVSFALNSTCFSQRRTMLQVKKNWKLIVIYRCWSSWCVSFFSLFNSLGTDNDILLIMLATINKSRTAKLGILVSPVHWKQSYASFKNEDPKAFPYGLHFPFFVMACDLCSLLLLRKIYATQWWTVLASI